MNEEARGLKAIPEIGAAIESSEKILNPNRLSAFARRVLSLLERTEYRLCESGEDLEAIYNLRYKSYVLNGIIDPNPEHLYYDEIDEAPSCRRYGVFVDNRLVSTVRIHLLDHENRQSPSTIAFGDLLVPRLDAGEIFIDPSRLATDPEITGRNPLLPYVTLRIAVAASVHFRANYCLSTVRLDHAGFYRKIFLSERIAEPRPYPGSKVPVIMYQGDVRKLPQIFSRYPFFDSSPAERRLLFDRPSIGVDAPLTVIPTVPGLDLAA